MSAEESEKITVVCVPLHDLREIEYVAIEVIGENDYDETAHPGLVTKDYPFFYFDTKQNSWRLLTPFSDDLFVSTGYVKHTSEIHEYLSKQPGAKYQEFNIDEFNAQATNPLVPGIDYSANVRCNLPKRAIDDKSYFMIDVFSYMSRIKDTSPDKLVSVFVFGGQRLHEIAEEEEQRIITEKPLHLSVHCEAGQFICAILAKDTLTFKYNLEDSTFTLTEADSSRLYLMYARTPDFIKKVSDVIMHYLTASEHISLLHMHTNNTTIEISAMLLELKYGHQYGMEERQDCRALLHKYNLDRLASTGMLLEREFNRDTDAHMVVTYIDIHHNDYLARKTLFIDTFGREPYADFVTFADTDLSVTAIND